MTEYRYTAYSGPIPIGHGATVEEALAEAERRKRRGVRITKVVKRLRAYPYSVREVIAQP
jgi:hypothetical protein